jgi:glycosyltransferase involved in cell wall biosynthesis
MRIGIFILAAGRQAGGPEIYEVQLVRALARIDPSNDYLVYCTSPEAAAAVGPLPRNFTVRVLRPALRTLSVALTLPRFLAADRVDFFHSTYAPPPFPNRPFLFTMHCVSNFAHPEFYPAFIRWRLNALQRVALRRASAILCVSDFVSRYLREVFRIPAERLSTVYNGVGPEFFPVPAEEARSRVAAQFGIDSPYLLYVGKLQARKNVVGLLHAYARYRKQTASRRAVRIRIGTSRFCPSRLIARQTVRPSRPGIIRSSTIRSSFCSPAICRAWRPSPTGMQVYPSICMCRHTSSRMCASSSTTSTVVAMVIPHPAARPRDHDCPD